IGRRFDFRRNTELVSAPASAKDSSTKKTGPNAVFSSASFIDNSHLMLSGAKGGTVLAEIPSGTVVWSRPPFALLGDEQQIASDRFSNLAVVYDKDSAQLVSLDSGALLSRIVDFASMDINSKEIDETALASVDVLPGGAIRINYKGHV